MGENVDDVAAEEEMSVVRKQRFNDLAEILDEGNFDDLPPQDKKEFIYQNKQMAKNNEKIAWSTVKNNDTVAGPLNEPAAPSPSRIPVLVRNSVEMESSPNANQRRPPRKRTAENISKTTPGPAAATRDIKSELDAFNLFFTDDLLKRIVTYTNVNIQELN